MRRGVRASRAIEAPLLAAGLVMALPGHGHGEEDEQAARVLSCLPGNDAAGRSLGLPEAPACAASPLPQSSLAESGRAAPAALHESWSAVDAAAAGDISGSSIYRVCRMNSRDEPTVKNLLRFSPKPTVTCSRATGMSTYFSCGLFERALHVSVHVIAHTNVLYRGSAPQPHTPSTARVFFCGRSRRSRSDPLARSWSTSRGPVALKRESQLLQPPDFGVLATSAAIAAMHDAADAERRLR